MADTAPAEHVALASKIAAINDELTLLDAEREANDAKRLALRKEREGLSRLLDSAKVQHRIQTAEQAAAQHEQAAAKTRSEVEAELAAIKAKSAEVDKLLEEAKAKAAATATEPTAPEAPPAA